MDGERLVPEVLEAQLVQQRLDVLVILPFERLRVAGEDEERQLELVRHDGELVLGARGAERVNPVLAVDRRARVEVDLQVRGHRRIGNVRVARDVGEHAGLRQVALAVEDADVAVGEQRVVGGDADAALLEGLHDRRRAVDLEPAAEVLLHLEGAPRGARHRPAGPLAAGRERACRSGGEGEEQAEGEGEGRPGAGGGRHGVQPEMEAEGSPARERGGLQPPPSAALLLLPCLLVVLRGRLFRLSAPHPDPEGGMETVVSAVPGAQALRKHWTRTSWRLHGPGRSATPLAGTPNGSQLGGLHSLRSRGDGDRRFRGRAGAWGEARTGDAGHGAHAPSAAAEPAIDRLAAPNTHWDNSLRARHTPGVWGQQGLGW